MINPRGGAPRRRHWYRRLPVALLLAGCLLGGLALAQKSEPADPFSVPVLMRGDWEPWDPDRALRFTFHDRRGDEVTTGRYVTYSVPIGHTDRWGFGSPDEGSSGSTGLSHRLERAPDGGITIHPAATSNETWGWGSSRVDRPYFTADISALLPPGDRLLKKIMIQAKQENGPFPGYRLGQFFENDGRDYHYVGEHCGFEMFESVAHRKWHDRPPPFDLSRPPSEEFEPPFDRARLFGWPTGDGISYEHAVICLDSGVCRADERPRDWLMLRYRFRSEWLCEIPDIIPVHLDWLETLVVDEETEVLNPVFQGRVR